MKHTYADMFVAAETARISLAVATSAVAAGAPDALESAIACAALGIENYYRVAQANLVHRGGIGMTFECDAHLYLRRAMSNRALLGRADHLYRDLLDRFVDPA
jgi:alkylation response protein AidB-like acyl-CoA dehydrogenase